MLIDTNVVSEAARPHPDPEVYARLAAAEGHAAIAAVTWHELWFGVERMPGGQHRCSLAEFLHGFVGRYPVLPYDRRAAVWHANERARLERSGYLRAFADGQIAATAVTNGLTLVTRNLKDFAGYEELQVESWWSG